MILETNESLKSQFTIKVRGPVDDVIGLDGTIKT